MSTVDGIHIIDSYEESENEIRFKEKSEYIFTIIKGFNNPKEKLKYLIPFQMYYCYDCKERKYIHTSFTPIFNNTNI